MKAILESGTSQATHEIALKFGVSILIIFDLCAKLTNLNRLTDSYRTNKMHIRRKNVSMLAFHCFRGIKESLFCMMSSLVMKNGSSITIVRAQQSG